MGTEPGSEHFIVKALLNRSVLPKKVVKKRGLTPVLELNIQESCQKQAASGITAPDHRSIEGLTHCLRETGAGQNQQVSIC